MGKYEITGGKIPHARKVLVYGPEGVGKSTFASRFPQPLFIDTEGSTRNLDVMRMPTPTSWPMLLDEVATVAQERPCQTLVIDTADWAERMCARDLCMMKGWQGIEDAGWGKGYTYLAERFGQLLNLLEDVVRTGIHVVVTAHAKINKFEQPDEMGTYDRWELKLEKKTAPMLKEWADMILFANYKTIVVKDSNGKAKGQGGHQRVMYTTHTAAWDAKNRDDLPDMLSFDYNQIAHLFVPAAMPQHSVASAAVPQQPAAQEPAPMDLTDGMDDPTIVEMPSGPQGVSEKPPINFQAPAYQGLPPALIDLMKANMVPEEYIRKAVSSKGYFPEDMPIAQYPRDFIDGVLIGAWDQVVQSINDLMLPF